MIKEFETYVKESFFSKTFEERIDEIDKLFIIYLSLASKSKVDKHDTNSSAIKRSHYVDKTLNCMTKIIGIIDEIFIKFGKKLTQDQMDQVVKRFKTIEKNIGHIGWKLNDYSVLINLKNSQNSILNILYHFKEFYGLEVDIPENELKNPLKLFKENGYYYIVHKSYADRKEEESKEKHIEDDPYGEEDWIE